DTGGVVPDTDRLPITDSSNLPPPDPEFVVNVFDLTQSSTYPVEQFTCTLEQNTDDGGVATELEERINPFSQYIRVTSNVASLTSIPAVDDAAQQAMAGGDSGTAPTSFDVANAWAQFSNKQ